MSISRNCIPAILLALHSAPTVAEQAEVPLVLSPAGPWSVDFAEDSCAVSRFFEDGDQKTFVEFRTYAPGPVVQTRIASNSLPIHAGTPSTGFLPGGEMQLHRSARTFETDSGWRGVVFERHLPPAETANGDYLIEQVFDQDLQLKLGPLAEVIQVMRDCEDDLSRSLGIDSAPNRNLSRPITLDYNARWLASIAPMQRDFVKAGSYFQQIRLLVDEHGRVFGCKVVEGETDQSVATKMCSVLMSDAKFEPALDANSQPVKSHYLLALSARKSP